MRVAIADFETSALDGNVCLYPPEPCGLAYQLPGGNPQYVTAPSKIRTALGALTDYPCVFHNATFDLSVWRKWYGDIPLPTVFHDTMHLLFLNNPYSKSLSLKPSAMEHLGEAPTEQDALRDWIVRNVKGATAKNHGAYISQAPVELVRPYAVGDVTRTLGLFKKFEQFTKIPTYAVEMALMPILMESSRNGIRVDTPELAGDINLYTKTMDKATKALWKLFGQEFNLDSPIQLVEALERKGWMRGWDYTEKGNKSVAVDALKRHCTQRDVLVLLGYRGLLETLLGTFMVPWDAMANATGGRIHTTWNQVRSYEGGNQSGTRTGRLSSSQPNFQNVPTEPRALSPKGFPPLPHVRKYLLPEIGHVWAGRDFDSQEVRILAHFEDGALLEAYQKDPALDPHKMAQVLIKERTGLDIDRKTVKITAFAIVYGAGASGLAGQLGGTVEQARVVRDAYLKAFPGVRNLQQHVSHAGRTGEGITTLGGRHYTAEPPKLVGNQYRTFEYKLLNYLVQGSAADQTKKCIVDWYPTKHEDVMFLATVHDEINISIPKKLAKAELKKLQAAMDQPMSDCPMRSTAYVGENWGSIVK